MRRGLIISLFLTVCELFISITYSYAADLSKDHRLSCGRAIFIIKTQQGSAGKRKDQQLYVHLSNGNTVKADLGVAYKDLRKHGVPAYEPVALIEEWKCVKTAKNEFVELLFACNEDIGDANIDRYCGGSSMEEWTRYLSLDGKLLDAGFKIGDQRYKLLWKRLGLPNFADGETRTEVMVPVD